MTDNERNPASGKPAADDNAAKARRERLEALKTQNAAGDSDDVALGAGALDGESDSPINLGSMLAEKQDRLRQLKLLRGFFESPQWVDLTQELVPTSSTREEIEQRLAQINYQVDVLEALLELMRAERDLLMRADLPKTEEAPADDSPGGGTDT